jgi:hypothetical protein
VIGKILYGKEKFGAGRPITRISPKHQITIPKETFEKLRLEVRDYLEVQVTRSQPCSPKILNHKPICHPFYHCLSGFKDIKGLEP